MRRIEAHHEQCKPIYATLPWRTPFGSKQVTESLLLSTPRYNPIRRNTFDELTWNSALDAAGIPRTRENGTHALRHHYASVLLDAGESIKAVSEYLGHWDPGFTLRQYTHFLPNSQERTRIAIDASLENEETASWSRP